MKLSVLAAAVGVQWTGADPAVTFLTDNSAKVAQDCVFICIEGRHFDGHSKAAEALENGAAAVVVSRDLGLDRQILVENTRSAYAYMAAAFFDHPERKLRLIGVTGTNGKTTSCFILRSILTALGKKTGLIGTVKNMVGDQEFPAVLTTPDCFELFSLFARMVEAGCDYCVMEVSSQALDQHRVDGVRFDAAIFTNLTQDHLDYHGTFENYRAAKTKLFAHCDLAVVNIDDPAAREMLAAAAGRKVTFSIEKDACDYSAKNIRMTTDGIKYELVSNDTIGRASFVVPGRFSVYNSMGAAVCLIELGFPFRDVLQALAACEGVPGRMEIVPTDRPYTVLIDYAHTPDGLENVLRCVREVATGRVICVFGCGGDRDSTKRPLMGEIASRLSDIAVVTSDNPRTEDPDAIIEDIRKGLHAGLARIIVDSDRRSAIRRALSAARAGDVVVLAGKGQETYQILKSGKIHFDEREVVAEILQSKMGDAE
ncbi:MAG: UDP-N-acetylmuramoyl-L-alanyl-D-glutamate--2,6-diaminopimelate ligase [Clostridia bacterium]|nr:UDP-N-acetylmuramoyl-L-alanyl-D-glutamate--2,6-diaminopimelate ligase [Clostridia bacterium]